MLKPSRLQSSKTPCIVKDGYLPLTGTRTSRYLEMNRYKVKGIGQSEIRGYLGRPISSLTQTVSLTSWKLLDIWEMPARPT
jgi:hypothetical protein